MATIQTPKIEFLYSNISEAKTIYKTKFKPEHKIMQSSNIDDIIRPMIGDRIELQEVVYIVLLNRANQILAVQRISEGSQCGSVCDSRTILKTAIDLLAYGVILIHNHPSDNLKPSESDKQLTNKVKTALALVDITLMDHVILAPYSGFYSFADEGLL